MIALLKKYTFNFVYYFFEKQQLAKINTFTNKELLFVIDIDNTLTINKLNVRIDHTNPKPRINLINHLAAQKTVATFVFLSARDFRLFDVTYKWLQQYGLIETSKQLFLVDESMSKIAYLQRFIANNQRVVYFDDLSYNHENGEVKYYDTVIERVKQLDLTYYDVNYINQFVQ